MNSLKVPENGLLLAGSGSGSESAIPQQAFQLTLNSSVIEAMIRSARNGEEMRLDLGKSPVCSALCESAPIPQFTSRKYSCQLPGATP